MSDTKVCNAIITSVSLGDDDHGGTTFWLHLDYGSSRQGFGGFGFGSNDGPPLVFAHIAIREILRVIDVREWDALKDKTCRAEITDGLVSGIGHIIKDEWFRPKEHYERYGDSEYRIQLVNTLARHAEGVLDLVARMEGERFAEKHYEVRLLRETLAKVRAA